MERSLKASDSVVIRSVIGPIAIGFVLGFLLVGATRLQPDQQAIVAADASEARSMTGDKPMMGDNGLVRPTHASTTTRPAGPARGIIRPLF